MKAIIILTFVLTLSQGQDTSFQPYSVLGVHRRASTQEIRKAYKKLAREWHPDKVTGDKKASAEAKFIQINRAYELLTDPERRLSYDNYGTTEDSPNFRKNAKEDVYSKYRRFESSFNNFFGGNGGGFHFRFHSGGNTGQEHRLGVFHKQTITSKAYYQSILPRSSNQPYLLMFYSDWCFTCMRIEPIWTRLTEELEPVGFGIATVHTEHEKELSRKIAVKELPHMLLLLDGKLIHYKDPQFSAVKAIEFIRRKMPYKMVDYLTPDNIERFLSGWTENKVRVIIFGRLDIVRLRYLTTAFKYRNRAAFGYINLNDPGAQALVSTFRISKLVDSMLVFNEDTSRPVATVSMKDIPTSTLNEVMEANQFLLLPRLSSQGVFDTLCPPESSKMRRRLCVVLISPKVDEAEDESRRQGLRDFLQEFRFSKERVRFAYVFKDKQHDFVNSLVSDEESPKNLAIVWRTDSHQVRYQWFPEDWPVQEDEARLNESSRMLRKLLQDNLRSGSDLLSREAILKELVDEHATTLFVRIANRMLEAMESIRESVTKDELLPAISLVVTVGLVLAGGYVMNYLVKMEEESVRKQLGAKGLKVDKKGKVVPELKIHELRAETYNGMVRLLKPGCRTIVLIVDRESKEKLVPKFYKFAWPYRRNKTLMFGFLYIEKGLPWFKKILNLTLPEPRDININPKNCIGTVLSLNGHRRYFCMYHAKHPEGSRRKVYTANNGAAAGAFMGFDSEFEDSGSDGERDVEGQIAADPAAKLGKTLDSPDHLPIFEDQLLDGLQMWLDRLFEGSTYRYHINYWPEFPISPANFSTSSSTSSRQHSTTAT